MVGLTLCMALGASNAVRRAVLLAPLMLPFAVHAATMPGNDAVLLASTAPGYAPGMVIAAEGRLTLPDGASATLLFRSGRMLRVRGPFEGALTAVAAQLEVEAGPGAAKALPMQGVDAAVIGGTRAITAKRLRPAPDNVRVDPQRSDTYCLKSDDFVWIRRPSDDGGSYSLRRKGNTRALQWPVGVARIPWPDDVPIEDDDRFEFIVDGAAKVMVTFRVMANRPASDAAWVAEGILRGCRDQFDPALEQLAKAVVAPELWLTTDHGRAPVYHSGEPIQVTVQSSSDGYLYCLRAWNGGEAMPVFPTSATNDARVRGAVPVAIPGPRQGTELWAGRPGTEELRCWLTDRDISAELPNGFFASSARTLPDAIAGDPDKLSAGAGAGRNAKASLMFRIE